MTKRKALIVLGGWDGHQPKEVSGILGDLLLKEGFDVEISDTLDSLTDVPPILMADLYLF